jgi:sugar lactone lactonase YvrE
MASIGKEKGIVREVSLFARDALARPGMLGIRVAAAFAAAVVASMLVAAPAFAGPGPIITDFAGTGTCAAPVAGPATSSPMCSPYGVAVDSSGNVYMSDTSGGSFFNPTNNFVVEKVTPSGTLSIVAGVPGSSGAPTPGPATSSELGFPAGVAVDSGGDVYIADIGNDVVEKVTPSGTLSIFAGIPGSSGAPTAGPATSSDLGSPQGVAVDPAGDVYIADFNNDVIEKVTPSGTLSIFAGVPGSSGAPTAGPATSSTLSNPGGVAVDSAGDVYIADTNNNAVEKVTPSGTLSVFAGIPGSQGTPTPGPATSSKMTLPTGAAIDSAGDVYIADQDNFVVEKVTPSGTLSIFAGIPGSYGAPTYGGAPTASSLSAPSGVAVDADGTVFIADTGNNTIDRVGLVTAGAPGQPALIAGHGSAQLSFTPPVDGGTSPITGYEVSLDGGATWTTITTSPGANGTLAATLTGLTDGTTYSVAVRAVNGSGPGAASPTAPVTPRSAAPTNTGAPELTGTAAVGQALSCSPGSWTGGATRYSYQWNRDGLPLPSASGQSYIPTSADQGHTLTCTVTAYSSSGGSTQATSPGVLIPIVNVSLCPKPTGRLSASRLGPIRLGMGRRQARRMLPRFAAYSQHTDNFCLAGGAGVRVGYATRHLLRKLPGHPRATGIVLALTANPYYQFDGIRPGSSLRAAAGQLTLGRPIHWGPNSWYVIASRNASWVLKVQHGTVTEIGIASHRLTATRADQTWLLASF